MKISAFSNTEFRILKLKSKISENRVISVGPISGIFEEAVDIDLSGKFIQIFLTINSSGEFQVSKINDYTSEYAKYSGIQDLESLKTYSKNLKMNVDDSVS